eukprot:34992-Hanusia_phi.AAC.1
MMWSPRRGGVVKNRYSKRNFALERRGSGSKNPSSIRGTDQTSPAFPSSLPLPWIQKRSSTLYTR